MSIAGGEGRVEVGCVGGEGGRVEVGCVGGEGGRVEVGCVGGGCGRRNEGIDVSVGTTGEARLAAGGCLQARQAFGCCWLKAVKAED